MLDAAREIDSFRKSHNRADLQKDRLLTFGLLKAVEVIGEAASRVSPETQGSLKQIPWRDIVAMRNRLVHTYFDVNFDIVWSTITEDIPPLIAQLESILEGDQY